MNTPTTAIPIAVYAYQRHKQPTDPNAVKRIGFYDKRRVKEETKFQAYYVRAKAVPSRSAFKEYQQSLVDAKKIAIANVEEAARKKIEKLGNRASEKKQKKLLQKESKDKVRKLQKEAIMRNLDLDRRYIHDIKYEKNLQIDKNDPIYVYIPVKYYKINTSKFDPIAGNVDGLLAFGGQSKWNMYNGKTKDVDFIYDNEVREETQKELFEYLLKVKIIDTNGNNKLDTAEESQRTAEALVADFLRKNNLSEIKTWGDCGYLWIHRAVYIGTGPLLISTFTFFDTFSGVLEMGLGVTSLGAMLWKAMKQIFPGNTTTPAVNATTDKLKFEAAGAINIEPFIAPIVSPIIDYFNSTNATTNTSNFALPEFIPEPFKPRLEKIGEAILELFNYFKNVDWMSDIKTFSVLAQLAELRAYISSFNIWYRLAFNNAMFFALCYMTSVKDTIIGKEYAKIVCLISKMISDLSDYVSGNKIPASILYARDQTDLLKHIKLDLYPNNADIINMLKKKQVDEGGTDLTFFGFDKDITPRLVLNNEVDSILIFSINKQEPKNIKKAISLSEGPIFVYVIASMKKNGEKYWYYYDYNYDETDPDSDFFKVYEVAAFTYYLKKSAVLSGPIPKPGEAGGEYCQRKIGDLVISGVPYFYYYVSYHLVYSFMLPAFIGFSQIDEVSDIKYVFEIFQDWLNNENSGLPATFFKWFSDLERIRTRTTAPITTLFSLDTTAKNKLTLDVVVLIVRQIGKKMKSLPSIYKWTEKLGKWTPLQKLMYLFDFLPCTIAVFLYNRVNKNKQNYV